MRRATMAPAGVGVASFVAAMMMLSTVASTFSATTSGPPSTLSAQDLSAYVPTAVAATRTSATTCLVTWTPAAGTPPVVTYDVTDGAATNLAVGASSGVSVTVPVTALTPTVRARVNTWVSSAESAAMAPCAGFPDPPGSLVLTPTDGALSASWSAPAGNGGTVASYSATISPAPNSGSATCSVAAPTTTCAWSALDNGTAYTVTVTATSNVGTGPASSATGFPFPSTVMTPARLRLWLDGADGATLYADSSCSGGAATTSIGCWADKSGQGNHAVQASVASRPVLAAANLPRSAPTFDGSDDRMTLNPSLLPTGTSASTQLHVVQPTDPALASSSYRTVLAWGTASTNLKRIFAKDAGSAAVFADAHTNGYSSPGSFAANTTTIGVSEFAGASVRTARDGTAYTAGTAAAFNTSSANAYLASWGSSYPWQGPIPEVIVVAGTLSTGERRAVEEYLARKWAVAVPPSAPTSPAATAGDTSVAVTWGAPTWNGGSAVTGYTATAVPSDGALPTRTCTAASTGCTLSGLTDGVTYSITVTATNAVGTGAASSTVTAIPYPASIMTTSRLRLWLDGADTTTLFASAACSGAVSSTAIGCWADKSGQGNHVVQTTAASRASTTSLNGHLAPTFDGVDDHFALATSTLPTGTTTSTTAMAAKLTGTVDYRLLMLWGNSAVGQARSWYLNSGPLVADAYSGAPTASSLPTTVAQNSQFQLISGFTSGSSSISVNGLGQSTAAAAVSTVSTSLLLGGLPGNPVWWAGPIPEVIVFTGDLATTERRTLDEYLARKWGTIITPGAPGGVSATGGNTQATVSWTAPWNGGAAITAYTITATPLDGSLSTLTASCTSSPCTVTGMTNGAPYTVTVTAANSVGTSPASSGVTVAAYPTSLFTSAAVPIWVDAQHSTSLSTAADCSGSDATTGSQIGCWRDRSGNGHDAPRLSATGATLTASAINGRQALRFDKTQPHSYAVTSSGVGALAAANRSILAVAASRSTAGTAGTNNAATIAIWNQGWGTGLFAKAYGGTTAVDTYQADSYNASLSANYVSTPATASPTVISAVFSSAVGAITNAVAANGVGTSTTSTIAGSWDTAHGDSLAIGAEDANASADYSYPLDGDLGEILVFNRALTAAERRTGEEYLARHWGVVIAPAAPTLASVTKPVAGQLTATWSSPAWNGGATVTSHVATATASGYTTRTCSGAGTSCTITGLTAGVTYTVTVADINTAGTGPDSNSRTGTA